MPAVVRIISDGREMVFPLYDVEPADGLGRVDWGSVLVSLNAVSVSIERLGVPGVFPTDMRTPLAGKTPGKILAGHEQADLFRSQD